MLDEVNDTEVNYAQFLRAPVEFDIQFFDWLLISDRESYLMEGV